MGTKRPGKSTGKTDWERLRAQKKSAPKPFAAEIDAARDLWADADIVIPGGKTRITAWLDTDVVEWFKSRGSKYQTRMNAVLRQYMIISVKQSKQNLK